MNLLTKIVGVLIIIGLGIVGIFLTHTLLLDVLVIFVTGVLIGLFLGRVS